MRTRTTQNPVSCHAIRPLDWWRVCPGLAEAPGCADPMPGLIEHPAPKRPVAGTLRLPPAPTVQLPAESEARRRPKCGVAAVPPGLARRCLFLGRAREWAGAFPESGK